MSVAWTVVKIVGEVCFYLGTAHYLWITSRRRTVRVPGGVVRTSKKLNAAERNAISRLYSLILRDYDKRARK